MSGPHSPATSASSRRSFYPPFDVDVLPDLAPDRPPYQTAAAVQPPGQPPNQPVNPQQAAEQPNHDYTHLLPATWRNANDDIETPRKDNYHSFLTRDLCVARLNAIHSSMWVVGRPMPPRPLTAQIVHRREPVLTEDINLHLVWTKGAIFVKPLPRYLLSHGFWSQHLQPGAGSAPVTSCAAAKASCPHKKDDDAASAGELAASGAGFLFSWAALIAHESDWRIARERGLIPAELSWPRWKAFTADVLDPARARDAGFNIYAAINRRFHYGELRLGRLNKIYRLQRLHVRGYLFRYTQKSDFFEENFARLASVLGYVVIVLTAMQVGLGTTRLQESQRFQDASYGFTVFSIIAPLIAVALVLAVFLYLVLWNVMATRKYEKVRFGHMGIDIESERRARTNDSKA